VNAFGPIAALNAEHDVSEFDCGSSAQTTWLRSHALQAQRADTATVFVSCYRDTLRVAGYYALAAGSVGSEGVPARIAAGTGRYPVPVVVLARLGVDVRAQGRGLGKALLRDAFLQTAATAERVGVRALVIHAESERAVAFDQRVDAGFARMPFEPLHVVLLMKDLRKAIRKAAAQQVGE
jgi:GNAT superfamily N-acetyltransferase